MVMAKDDKVNSSYMSNMVAYIVNMDVKLSLKIPSIEGPAFRYKKYLFFFSLLINTHAPAHNTYPSPSPSPGVVGDEESVLVGQTRPA